ncbi:hypothetical protein KQS06HV_91414 [Klebsiella quasipneumoniae subsp. similipneumoniae]|nr:hypothetical protein KPC142_01813 [Klebsiella quasipneumoniae]CDN07395.1 hypothetical protein SB30_250036 [Klebsiella quasipneumoniae subsp. similipneumoniae]SBA01604.1 hypothetical protein KQS06HV_91414 [Klebsiella quasipneumoniae subsp. similipneumoniae]
MIVQLYEYIRTILTIIMIGQVAAARVASDLEFGYSSRQPPIRAATAMRRATADTGLL